MDDEEAEAKEFKLFEDRMNALAHRKLGFPTSLLGSNPSFVHYELLGIRPGSLASILINHAGDPFIEADTYQMEVKNQEVTLINTLATYFGMQDGEGRGYVTTGGTEGNDACLRWSKQYLAQLTLDLFAKFSKEKNEYTEKMNALEENLSKVEKKDLIAELELLRDLRKIDIEIKKIDKILDELLRPSLFCTGDNTHYSIKKIAENLNFKYISIKSLKDGDMDLNDFEKKLNQHTLEFPYNPIIVNANIGTTFMEATDNVPKIKQILDNKDPKPIYTIHMDGALNGFVLPILKPFGEVENYFDFANTLAISFHKYLGLPQPSGLALTTKNFMSIVNRKNEHNVEYAGNIKDITISGSRSGFNILLIYNAVIYALGLKKTKAKIIELVNSDMARAKYFSAKLIEILGKENVFYKPNQFNIVIQKPSDKLIKKYQLMTMGDKAVICVLHNVTLELIDQFINDLKNESQEKNDDE